MPSLPAQVVYFFFFLITFLYSSHPDAGLKCKGLRHLTEEGRIDGSLYFYVRKKKMIAVLGHPCSFTCMPISDNCSVMRHEERFLVPLMHSI